VRLFNYSQTLSSAEELMPADATRERGNYAESVIPPPSVPINTQVRNVFSTSTRIHFYARQSEVNRAAPDQRKIPGEPIFLIGAGIADGLAVESAAPLTDGHQELLKVDPCQEFRRILHHLSP
jgi:hypothetical protein